MKMHGMNSQRLLLGAGNIEAFQLALVPHSLQQRLKVTASLVTYHCPNTLWDTYDRGVKKRRVSDNYRCLDTLWDA